MRRLVLSAALLAWPGQAFAQEQGSPLSAGGLAPPPAIESQGDPQAPPPNQTEAELERADREDSGRGLAFVWLNAEAGVGHFGLETITASNLVDESVKKSQTGLLLGAGLGLRLVFLTAGVRFRYGLFSDWKVWTLGAEGGIHMQLGSIEPYATLGLGYLRVAGIDPTPLAGTAAGADTRTGAGGFDARLALGFDYYLTNLFSVGVNVSGDIFTLARSAVAGAGQPGGLPAVYALDGSSVGAGAAATAVGGLHF
ncbi:MAG TPA: hypothetical protein VGK73_37130 [Polyangiaceae bacterium]